MCFDLQQTLISFHQYIHSDLLSRTADADLHEASQQSALYGMLRGIFLQFIQEQLKTQNHTAKQSSPSKHVCFHIGTVQNGSGLQEMQRGNQEIRMTKI